MTEPGTSTAIPAVLDHVAVAAETWQQAWPRYVEHLGGAWSSGDRGPGFAPCQLRYANGARLEILAPHDPEANPFLRRYIDRNGPGPHHLTFKVPDLDAAIDAVRQAGIEPVNVDRSDPGWQEAFLHPSRALGIVVQLAQQQGDWSFPAPADFPRPAEPAGVLVRATHAVADLAAGEALFAGLLGGAESARTASPDGATIAVDLSWAGPLGLRLVGPDPRGADGSAAGAQAGGSAAALHRWLGDRTGRLHHVLFAVPDQRAIPDAQPLPDPETGQQRAPGTGTEDILGVLASDGAVEVVPATANLGTRVVLARTNP